MKMASWAGLVTLCTVVLTWVTLDVDRRVEKIEKAVPSSIKMKDGSALTFHNPTEETAAGFTMTSTNGGCLTVSADNGLVVVGFYQSKGKAQANFGIVSDGKTTYFQVADQYGRLHLVPTSSLLKLKD